MIDGIEEVIVSLYAKGMSVADIEDQIKDVYNFEFQMSNLARRLQFHIYLYNQEGIYQTVL